MDAPYQPEGLDFKGIARHSVFTYSTNTEPKVRKLAPRPALHATRILGQLRERLRYLHYSLRTEESYVYWVRFFIHFHGLRHPREMGQSEVESFLTMLATTRRVSVSTHRQALSALLFLYKEVLDLQLPWLAEIGRPLARKRIPAVLTVAEVERVLGFMEGEAGLLASLLHGTGMRQMEGVTLRVKDVDFIRGSSSCAKAERRHHLFEERLSRALKRAVGLAGIDLHIGHGRSPCGPNARRHSGVRTSPSAPGSSSACRASSSSDSSGSAFSALNSSRNSSVGCSSSPSTSSMVCCGSTSTVTGMCPSGGAGPCGLRFACRSRYEAKSPSSGASVFGISASSSE
jgi:hypothetical protein